MKTRPRALPCPPPGDSLSRHILPNSANLVGVCIMALSLVKMLPRHGWSALIDEILASASVVFLVSVGLSYASLRLRNHADKFETWAESMFLTGLVMIIVATIVLAFGIQ